MTATHGWSLDGLAMFELSALEAQMRAESENTVFHPSDIELTETTRAVLSHIDKVTPQRVVFDSLSELRLLAQSHLRYRREGDFLYARFAKLIADEGGDLRHIVRVDQYYPSADCVNPYQRARKALLKDYVPPSTSVLMEELLVDGANMDVSMLAVLPGDGRQPRPARPEGVPVPPHSGFIPSLECGDYVFVAGQMPNNEAMTGLEPAAYRPPSSARLPCAERIVHI